MISRKFSPDFTKFSTNFTLNHLEFTSLSYDLCYTLKWFHVFFHWRWFREIFPLISRNCSLISRNYHLISREITSVDSRFSLKWFHVIFIWNDFTQISTRMISRQFSPDFTKFSPDFTKFSLISREISSIGHQHHL